MAAELQPERLLPGQATSRQVQQVDINPSSHREKTRIHRCRTVLASGRRAVASRGLVGIQLGLATIAFCQLEASGC